MSSALPSALRRTALAALAAAGALCANAAAAQGHTADIDISVEKTELVRLTGVDDWIIELEPADGNILRSQFEWRDLCVHSTTGQFNVTVAGSNSGADFRALSGDGTPMNYEVWSLLRIGPLFLLPVRHAGPFTLSNQRGSLSLTCADEVFDNANLFLAPRVRGSDFNPAPPGIYRDVVTIMVSPV